MTKNQLIQHLGSAAEIARFYGISDAAVSQWGGDSPIPRERLLELKLRRPDLFDASAAPAEAA